MSFSQSTTVSNSLFSSSSLFPFDPFRVCADPYRIPPVDTWCVVVLSTFVTISFISLVKFSGDLHSAHLELVADSSNTNVGNIVAHSRINCFVGTFRSCIWVDIQSWTHTHVLELSFRVEQSFKVSTLSIILDTGSPFLNSETQIWNMGVCSTLNLNSDTIQLWISAQTQLRKEFPTLRFRTLNFPTLKSPTLKFPTLKLNSEILNCETWLSVQLWISTLKLNSDFLNS